MGIGDWLSPIPNPQSPLIKLLSDSQAALNFIKSTSN